MPLKPVPCLGFLFLLLLAPGVLAAQQDSSLTEREEVTAIDLVVELSKDGETVVEPPDDLKPEEFAVERDGQSLAVVGLESIASAEPWHLLLYFDGWLSSTATTRWAASALADRAAALVELGDVEIVVADPEPRTLLAATRDADLVDQTLSGIFLKTESVHKIVSQREEFVLRREEEAELNAPGVARTLASEERRLIMQQQDAFLSTLISNLPGTARRAVFLVSDGFDQRPEDFYAADAVGDEAMESPLAKETSEWAKTVAAYGWSVIAVIPEESERVKQFGAVPVPNERSLNVKTPGITARLEGTLNPERAAALHELGQRLSEQGKLAEAEESLENALRYYHDHPKYTLQRAAVLIDLGEVLLDQDRFDEARVVLRQAVALDPGREAQVPLVRARLMAPVAPLESLATLSGGWVTDTEEGLSRAMAALARRVRLTFQFRGLPDGQMHGVRAELEGRGLTVRGPSWVRFGTPATVSALRARRLLAGEVEKGDLQVRCKFARTSKTYGSRKGELEIEFVVPAAVAAMGSTARLTIGLAAEEGPFEVQRHTVSLDETPLKIPLEVDDDDVWLSVVLDDLTSGRWGGASAEIQ